MPTRRQQAEQIRINAAKLAANRPHPEHKNNGEEVAYRRPTSDGKNEPSYIANFTKGLPHDRKTGLLLNGADYRQFVQGIQSGSVFDFAQTPLGPAPLNNNELKIEPGCLTPQGIKCDTENRVDFWESQIAKEAEGGKGAKVRAWESAGAGLTFELEGADAQAVTMPPAPKLDSAELAAEMSEVYLQALLRDVHVSQLRDNNDVTGTQQETLEFRKCRKCPPKVTVDEAVDILNQQSWFQLNFCDLNSDERDLAFSEALRDRQRGTVTKQNIFRGITPGDTEGPYLSQFILIGNTGVNGKDNTAAEARDGMIAFGSIRIDQRVRVATPCKDYMTTFEAWVDVQNGADLRGRETYLNNNQNQPQYRFITTPRDLATYVHYDALYEAYLNACLIMLGQGVPFDPGIPFQQPDVQDKQQGFAQFGGPQILTLVCEVATRALKAVRFQKFNTHRRLRPEAVAGLIHRYKNPVGLSGEELQPVSQLVKALGNYLLDKIKEHNKCQNNNNSDRSQDSNQDSYLLPMAFAEGSPMHPSYGAGHATVAGACVTILKAFFDHGFIISKKQNNTYVAYEPNQNGKELNTVTLERSLTVEGELNKLASNISIGRDWAGVHYFTDYIESLRLGERIAISILEEQKLTYGENFTMTVPLFDGGAIRI